MNSEIIDDAIVDQLFALLQQQPPLPDRQQTQAPEPPAELLDTAWQTAQAYQRFLADHLGMAGNQTQQTAPQELWLQVAGDDSNIEIKPQALDDYPFLDFSLTTDSNDDQVQYCTLRLNELTDELFDRCEGMTFLIDINGTLIELQLKDGIAQKQINAIRQATCIKITKQP